MTINYFYITLLVLWDVHSNIKTSWKCSTFSNSSYAVFVTDMPQNHFTMGHVTSKL